MSLPANLSLSRTWLSRLQYRGGPRAKECCRLCLRKSIGSRAYVRWNPLGERQFFYYVSTRGRVLLTNRGQSIFPETLSQPDNGGPQPTIHICDFAVDEAANKNAFGIPHKTGRPKDFLAFGVVPPVSPYGTTCHSFCKVWNSPFCALEYDSLSPNKTERVNTHLSPLRTYADNVQACQNTSSQRGLNSDLIASLSFTPVTSTALSQFILL